MRAKTNLTDKFPQHHRRGMERQEETESNIERDRHTERNRGRPRQTETGQDRLGQSDIDRKKIKVWNLEYGISFHRLYPGARELWDQFRDDDVQARPFHGRAHPGDVGGFLLEVQLLRTFRRPFAHDGSDQSKQRGK